MCDKNECAEGCGGCVKEAPWGRSLADFAIRCMDSKRGNATPEPESLFSEEDVDAFLDNCDENGKDPLDVVEHLAKAHGISLREENTDPSKSKIHAFLREILKRVAFMFVAMLVDNSGFGAGSLLSLILKMIKTKKLRESSAREGARSGDGVGEDAGCEEDEADDDPDSGEIKVIGPILLRSMHAFIV